MAEIIRVTRQADHEDPWRYMVELGINSDNPNSYIVEVSPESYAKLSDGTTASPGDLVLQSFRFLLERESKEQILPKFNIEDISRYFPDYPRMIKQKL